MAYCKARKHKGDFFMRRFVRTAFLYALLGMAGGVFFREFTKWNGFEGKTTLSVMHTHFFVLGMLVFLIAALFEKLVHLSDQKTGHAFFLVYNIGLMLTGLMLLIRGIMQTLSVPLTAGADAAISGVSGLGHILLGTGIVLFFIALLKCVPSHSKKG